MPGDGGAPEPPPTYPSRWEADVVLADGGTVHLRPIRPDDADLLADFHGRQSSESIYFRFFSPRPRLSERELERFTTVDYFDRMAFVALLGEEMVGMAGYDRFHGSREAEVAFIVDDGHQRRGIATVMLEYLATAGREVGLDAFTAQVLPSNRKMLRVFHRAGFDTSSAFADGVIEVRLDLEPTETVLAAIADRERTSGIRSVERLLEPRSVAVIGASRDPSRLGHRILRNLLEHHFAGPVYPVNRNASHVASVRAWPDVIDVPDTIDLAIVAVPAHEVRDVVGQCAEKRVRALLVVTSGFRALEPEGTAAERQLVDRARGSGMRLLGPTAMGVLNTRPGVSLCAVAGGPVTVEAGRAAVLSQSGALGLALLEHARHVGVGVSTFVGVGDRADVSGNDLLAYWEQDERTDVVLVYYDSLGNPTNFNRIARRIGRVKPVVMVKSGAAMPVARRDDGAGWPATATMEELLGQAGVIRVDSIRQLFDVGRLVLHQPLPSGRRVAIVANAAGPARLAADACVDAGLELASLSPGTRGAVAAASPLGAVTDNPVDLTFEVAPHHYEAVVAALAADPGVDAVLAVYAAPAQERVDEVARAIAVASEAHGDVPVVATFLGRPTGQLATTGNRALCFFPFPEEAVQALGRVAAYAEWRATPVGEVPELAGVDRDAASGIVAGALADGTGGWLDRAAAGRLLETLGVGVPGSRVVADEAAAVAAADEIGYPVALKATGLERFFATEAGGVALDLHDAAALRAAYQRMSAMLGAAMHPAEVQAMVPSGVDVRIAAHQHPSYGGVVVLGLGGSMGSAEVSPPVRILPLTDVDATSLVAASAVAPLLGDGPEGEAAAAALTDLLLRLADLVEAVPELAEVVLDPVLVSSGGAAITKAEVRVAPWRWEDDPPVRRLG